jgi:hypothetical protein
VGIERGQRGGVGACHERATDASLPSVANKVDTLTAHHLDRIIDRHV